MPWKAFKGAFLQKPSRQEVIITLTIVLVAAVVIGFFVLRS
ncbi:Hypothetical protein DEACI_3961 [Acididesulfobacillus acetoxydans]|uniref:SecE/Sec61-gamma subunits of protein translocation complex n=1 Tax=Acididesulfobacillus acetoxydans TaxID=1561005 RepID=A0A8S0W5H0_9FIRM|nr:preprotein translocase subunit SecE [Acididesulfobacillus acetoxydans]CAA7603138.1 Hypothetical protein DEACI_3961 [Acididesulfobacillus acetoxydans]CEJ07634.1 SecE/Sec61-gamma subunits of protein translocation complex [Acididesulfobacillus acetoxydans]